ncbi:MAG: GtrA family protein [Anaerolineales bacterium]|nr:GtrA family protein [Anaerolineales bacterium]
MTGLVRLARRQPVERKRFIKFLIVGTMGFMVDFGTFNLLHAMNVGEQIAHRLLPIPYLLTHPEVIEQATSFCAAVLNNFLWNYGWIYPEARQSNQAKKLTKFFIVSVAGLLIGVPVFTLALSVTRPLVAATALSGLQSLLPNLNLAGNLALVCRVAVLLFWNFFVNRFWTYRDVKRR